MNISLDELHQSLHFRVSHQFGLHLSLTAEHWLCDLGVGDRLDEIRGVFLDVVEQ